MDTRRGHVYRGVDDWISEYKFFSRLSSTLINARRCSNTDVLNAKQRHAALSVQASLPNLPASNAARASRNQFLGFQHLSSLVPPCAARRQHCKSACWHNSQSGTDHLTLTTAEKEAHDAQYHVQDRREVERELRRVQRGWCGELGSACRFGAVWDVSWHCPLVILI